MRKFAYIILSIVVVSVLAGSSALAQAKKAEANQTAKITQKEAQAAVIAKYPAAHVTSCELGTVKGNSVWTVRFTRTGGNVAEQVMVDAQTGKVTKL
jgi:uncharacterized membrane protein YkoI